MNIEEIRDCYFNYLVNAMLEALVQADDYDCKDFNALKLEMMVNINKMLQSREQYNKIIQILRENEDRNRGL